MTQTSIKTATDTAFLLSIIVPVFNEQEVLHEFYRRLTRVLDGIDAIIDITFVNDGSTDYTLLQLQEFQANDPRVAILDLSRNFGKEIAMTAGLDHVCGDAVIIIDADLQDPPELIPQMIEEWRHGFDVVYAQRRSRTGESALKKATASLFYRIMQRISRVQIPIDTGDFRLLSRRAVDALAGLRERHRFMKGLFAWIGYPQKAILYDRDARHEGTSKWNYLALWNFALEGITSFSTLPLKVATYLGTFTAFGAFLYGLFIIFQTLFFGNPVAGYPSLLVVVLFLGGIQLMALGVIGEYLGRMFDETKGRPLYLIKDYLPAASGDEKTIRK
ncbi:MAG: glycosyltransferase family 2 protein [Gammaproteobacteria bacterium]|nr:glycosyltransferase family 2 protein [Gammaproteobacteria bacterium]MCF6362435.1 glycosyltransferase family 2 protein [Gammaproteobacteria bacterium]